MNKIDEQLQILSEYEVFSMDQIGGLFGKMRCSALWSCLSGP